jgi:alpha-L-fucosidase
MIRFLLSLCASAAILLCVSASVLLAQPETKAQHDARMQWWREARFGLFIHWGLYSIPAGEWDGNTSHGEWIRTTAHIPLAQYDGFVGQFNPVKFNAEEWVLLAKEAGMKYIVITSKHHDGFCLFDSKFTDFDVMSTPFHRDILKQLSAACHKHGLKMCWYHSIMDWHHPDYLPRREWENDRSTDGADFNRYVQHMKNQIRELLTNYGEIGVLWFDGEWESTWNETYGRDLYSYVRGLSPSIIVNNRVGAGRAGMEGLTKEGEFGGDFGTPEQQIPATGLPGVDWETCMTMNEHWGYNKFDQQWKSTKDILQMLADVASKGGNYLLNVGPTPEGVFPQASVTRLREIGKWTSLNGESIYGTGASPFRKLSWGRATQKVIPEGTRLYLHVFDWPANGRLVIPGIYNQPVRSYLLVDKKKVNLRVAREEDALCVNVPSKAPDTVNSVVVLDVEGRVDVNNPPTVESAFTSFIGDLPVTIGTDRERVEVHYTTDGSVPTANSPVVKNPIVLSQTTTIAARCFRDGKPVSGTETATFTKIAVHPALVQGALMQGLHYRYYDGEWDSLPDFRSLRPTREGTLANIDLSPRKQAERFGFEYSGFLRLEEDDVYAFFTSSDDGSRLFIDDSLVVDNDGLHGMQEKRGDIALAKGVHSIRIPFFQKSGGYGLTVSLMSLKMEKQLLPAAMLFRKP